MKEQRLNNIIIALDDNSLSFNFWISCQSEDLFNLIQKLYFGFLGNNEDM